MKPSIKHPTINKMLNNIFDIDREGSITNNECVSCKKPIVEFKDVISLKEYTISGLCQLCQDEVFNSSSEEY
jgi:hypothetical protein